MISSKLYLKKNRSYTLQFQQAPRETGINNRGGIRIIFTFSRCSGNQRSNWYQKSEFSEGYLNFNSDHPFSHELNVINNLKKGASLLSTREPKIMFQNRYSKKLTEKILNRDIYFIRNDASENNERIYRKIIYISGFSEKIRKSQNEVI